MTDSVSPIRSRDYCGDRIEPAFTLRGLICYLHCLRDGGFVTRRHCNYFSRLQITLSACLKYLAGGRPGPMARQYQKQRRRILLVLILVNSFDSVTCEGVCGRRRKLTTLPRRTMATVWEFRLLQLDIHASNRVFPPFLTSDLLPYARA